MYTNNDALVTYQDSRLIERRDMYTSRPEFYVSKNQTVGVAYSPTRIYPSFDAPVTKRVIDPQKSYYRSISTSPTGYGQTYISLNNKRGVTKESPIMKVTTTKQMFYPSYQDETEEVLELPARALSPVQTLYAKPLYSKPEYYASSNKKLYSRKYDNLTNYYDALHTKKNETLSNYKKEEKRHDKTHRTTYVPKEPVLLDAITTYPTQTLVPMYTEVPVYTDVPVYGSRTYYPVTSTYKYTPSTYYRRVNGGKP